jgi:hypothetical protein
MNNKMKKFCLEKYWGYINYKLRDQNTGRLFYKLKVGERKRTKKKIYGPDVQ